MLIKSALATQMSGSIGGMTAAHNKGGMYLRGRSIPTDPNSAAQQVARASLATLVADYVELLTEAQREGWRTYAQNVTTTNALGDVIQLSGQNWFVALNAPRVRSGLTQVNDAPDIFDHASLNPVSITAIEPTNVEITYDDSQSWVDDPDSGLIVQLSRPVNQSVRFFKGPFRFVGALTGDDTTPPTSPYVLTSPFAFDVGQVMHARVRLSLSDGRLSTPQIARIVAIQGE